MSDTQDSISSSVVDSTPLWDRLQLVPYEPDLRSLHELVADLILDLPTSGHQRTVTIPETAKCERVLTELSYNVYYGHPVSAILGRCPNQATTSALGKHVCQSCATEMLT